MAGVWDALGEGISRGVAAYLANRAAAEQRQRDEEEKARLEREWLFSKMKGEAEMSGTERDRLFREQQYKDARAAAEQARLDAIAAAAKEHEYRMAEIGAGREGRGGKEPEKTLYDKQGFNGEVALFYALANQGLKSDAELSQYLNGPNGQTIAENLVSRLVSTHKERWPNRDLETDFWNFFKARNPRLQSSADRAAANAAQQQLLAQQQAAREAEAAARAQQRAEWQARQVPLPKTPAQIQQALEQPPQMFVSSAPAVASPELVMGVAMPQTLEEMVMGPRAAKPSAYEQQIIDQYKNPNTPEAVRSMMMNTPATKQILDKYRNLL